MINLFFSPLQPIWIQIDIVRPTYSVMVYECLMKECWILELFKSRVIQQKCAVNFLAVFIVKKNNQFPIGFGLNLHGFHVS